MGCFEDGLKNICEPYGGNMPLFNSPNVGDASVTIVSQSYDDGMKVTKISTPPRTETRTLIDAIDQALGLVHNLDLEKMIPDEKDGKKDDKVSSKRKQTDKQDGDESEDELQKPRGFGSALSDSEQRMAEED